MNHALALATAFLVATPAMAQNAADTLEAQVMTAEGESAGTVTFEQVEHGVVVTARLENLPEGPHGFHIHETGACEPDFQAAGGHYNPQDNEHGFDTPDGYHAGDLPNVYVAADGTAAADFFTPQLTLAEQRAQPGQPPFSLRDADGSAVMVHESIDDYRAATPDSTGARIACGVIAEPRS
jgi:superoxide dismutase, Cu-Zn family